MNLYLQCALTSLIGLGLSLLFVIRNLTQKAALANVIFDWSLFWRKDLWIQVTGTLLTVALGLMYLGPFFKKFPKFADETFFTVVFFSGIGYFGSDIASRWFSVVNKRINGAIDFKTTEADKASGNLNAPTPATKQQP